MSSIEKEYSGRVLGAANAIGFAGGAVGTVMISDVVGRNSVAAGYFAVATYFLTVTIAGTGAHSAMALAGWDRQSAL